MILMAFHRSFHYFSQKFPEREKLFSVFAKKKLEAESSNILLKATQVLTEEPRCEHMWFGSCILWDTTIFATMIYHLIIIDDFVINIY